MYSQERLTMDAIEKEALMELNLSLSIAGLAKGRRGKANVVP